MLVPGTVLVILAACVLFTLAAVLLVPSLVLFTQALFAMLPVKSKPIRPGRDATFAILIPAHNEEAVIAGTLASVNREMGASGRILVVADNCADGTAALARAAGAEVIERTDDKRRGKGYALDFGIRHLQQAPPDALVIIDADCQVGPGSIRKLVQLCNAAKSPVQALYLMRAPEGAGLKIRIAEFAWLVKNQVRPTGFLRLGLPCQLMGAGMAFVWSDIQQINLASGHLVEDLKLGLDLCRTGKPPLLCLDALMTSEFPISNEGQKTQRTRWEHGHLGMIFADSPKLIVDSVADRNLPLLALTLDLIVPPLALHTMLTSITVFASLILYLAYEVRPPLLASTAGLVMIILAIFISWNRYGRDVISLKDLAFAPVYAAAKVPLYLQFLIHRQVEWVRSNRK
jgi:cellulose synthase/poly-beta-1,6-N-acetylglucosamine synthase-like glycosyltransferase